MFPFSLQNRLESLIAQSSPRSDLSGARKQLTDRYRSTDMAAGFRTVEEVMAYVAVRLPATFAALQEVLSHIPALAVSSILDLGAGPGTAALAAALHWPQCEHFHLMEGDSHMHALSQELLRDIPEIAHQRFFFEKTNIVTSNLQESYDLVFLSYVLTELSLTTQKDVVKKAWGVAQKGLIIVTPGTPVAYEQLMILRDLLTEEGAFIAAPCPHQDACPLTEGDWCHFSAHVPRSSFHRKIKEATLSYEHEKFSYLVILRDSVKSSPARVIRKPLMRSGHVTLDLCTKEGLKRQTVSRRAKDHFKAANKLRWGDGWGN